MNTTCLLHPFTNKYQPHTVCYPRDKGSSCCQEMSVCLWRKKKKNPCRAVRNRVCISCGMIPTWQQNLNIIVHWTMKRNGVSGCSLPHSPPFPFCVFLVTLKIVKSLSWKKTQKHLKWWRRMVCHLFYSLEDVQFQFGLNAFACSLRMVGQCVSGQTKM